MHYIAAGVFLLILAGLAYVATRKRKEQLPEVRGVKDVDDR